jgi:hypothetical protein
MKSTLITWRESIARLAALQQLRGSIAAIRDYPAASRESMLASLDETISEEQREAAALQAKLDAELHRQSPGDQGLSF